MNSPTPATRNLTRLQPGSSPAREGKPRRSLGRDAVRAIVLALWAADAMAWAIGAVPHRWDARALCAAIAVLVLWLADGERQRRADRRAIHRAIEAAMREAELATRSVAAAYDLAGIGLPPDLAAACAPRLRMVRGGPSAVS